VIKAMKNFLGLLLLLLLLPMASAFAQPNLTVGSASGAAGATVNTPVTFTNNGAVVAISFDITYDSTKVTPTPTVGSDGKLLPVSTFIKSPGTLYVVVLPYDPNVFPPKPLPTVNSGVLFTVPWAIAAGATGSTALTLTNVNVTFSNAQAAAVSAGTLTNGQITIGSSGVVCGDADGSGSADIVDALAIARYTVGLPPPPPVNTAAADVNGDNVDIVDALLIARSTVGLPTPGSCLPQP